MFREMLENVRKTVPLIHNITNYVTVNDCANMLLACGGSPIMADEPEEAEAITAICGGLNLNIGTLNRSTIPSMFAAGKKANALSHPVVLDPVGVGASALRTDTATALLKAVRFCVVKGNISEIKTLAVGSGTTKGVDADAADTVTAETLPRVVRFAKDFAKRTGAVIAITGATDIVADDTRACVIRNGHPLMAQITGTGCMLSAVLAAYVTANPQDAFTATAAAVCAMGLCGEQAAARMTACDGNASFRGYLIDAMYRLDGAELEDGAKYEMC